MGCALSGALDVAVSAEGSVVAGGGAGDEDVVGAADGNCIDGEFGSAAGGGVGVATVTAAATDAVAGSLKALIHPLSTKKS